MLFATIAMSYMQLSAARMVLPEFLEMDLYAAPDSTDTKAMASCALAHCAMQGMRCQFDKTCRNIQKCTKKCKEGDLKCQMHCSDYYAKDEKSSGALADVVQCMIKYECLPHAKLDCPVPKNVLKDFDISTVKGKWYVAKGYNEMTDCHDCQVSTYTVNGENVHDRIQYAVKKDLATTYPHVTYSKRDFSIELKAADKEVAGHFSGSMTKMKMEMSYDWYVIAADSSKYMLIWYCGNSPLLDGASGGVLYTRVSSYDKLADEDKTAIEAAAEASGIAGFKVKFMCTIEQRGCPSMEDQA